MEHISNHLTVTSAGLAKQELMPLATSEETALLQSLQDQKVSTARLDDLKSVLRYAMVKIGLRAANWPTDEEKGILFIHIVENYGGHTLKEIQLAFDMAIAGKLDVEVNCYENFSCLYFSNIMNAYRAWAKEAHKHVVKGVPSLPPSKEDMSDESMLNFIQSYKGRITPLELIPEFLYQWLRDTQRMWTEYTDPATLSEAVEYRKSQIRKALELNPADKGAIQDRANVKRMLVEGFVDPERSRIEQLARKILVRDYLNAMK